MPEWEYKELQVSDRTLFNIVFTCLLDGFLINFEKCHKTTNKLQRMVDSEHVTGVTGPTCACDTELYKPLTAHGNVYQIKTSGITGE